MQTTTSTDVSQLNSLLRGEMSAIETYRQAREKVGETGFGAEEMRQLQLDHRDAAEPSGTTSSNTAARPPRAREPGAPSPRPSKAWPRSWATPRP